MTEVKERLQETYETYAQKTKELLAESKEKSAEALERAMEEARLSLESAGEISRHEGARLKGFLKRDLQQTAKDIKELGERSKDGLHPRALKTGFYNLVGELSSNAKDLFDHLAQWADTEVSCKTGEVTAPTKLECKKCGERLSFKHSGHIPPCPKCHHSEFRRTR